MPSLRLLLGNPKSLLEEIILMITDIAEKVSSIIKSYTRNNPEVTAANLREYWLEFEPNKGIELIKAEQREQYEAIGIPIPILKAIGNEIAKTARKDVDGFIPLAQLLWRDYGREGRVVALIIFGAMELVDPLRLVPLLKDLCKQCVSWEDTDRLAMDAVEPIVRKYPDKWMSEMAAWMDDQNKWIRRASVTIVGRLTMKHPAYTNQCLGLTGRLLLDTDVDVRRAVSFSIRICAKTDPKLACAFLEKQVSAANPATVWVLCDVIKSMDRKIIVEFASLVPSYKKWSTNLDISSKDRRSIENVITVLQASHGRI
jgi:3-methyladenine DNA glycosylase AlkD